MMLLSGPKHDVPLAMPCQVPVLSSAQDMRLFEGMAQATFKKERSKVFPMDRCAQHSYKVYSDIVTWITSFFLRSSESFYPGYLSRTISVVNGQKTSVVAWLTFLIKCKSGLTRKLTSLFLAGTSMDTERSAERTSAWDTLRVPEGRVRKSKLLGRIQTLSRQAYERWLLRLGMIH
jgi:hypothetical protein